MQASNQNRNIKKTVFRVITVSFGIIFMLVLIGIMLGDNCPVQLVIESSPAKLLVPPMLGFNFFNWLYHREER